MPDVPVIVSVERGPARLTLTDSGSTLGELLQMFRQLLAGAGYEPAAIDRVMADVETVTDANYGGT